MRKKLETNAKKSRRNAEANRRVDRRSDSLSKSRVVTQNQKKAEANRVVNRRKEPLEGNKATSPSNKTSRIPSNIDARFPGARRLESLMDAAVDQNDKAYKSWSARLAKARKEYRAWAIRRNKS